MVDAGGGKGNLASGLVLEYGLDVLGIDWNAQLETNAKNQFGRLQKNWDAMKKLGSAREAGSTQKIGGPRRGKAQKPQKRQKEENPVLTEKYRTRTHFITSETDFPNLIHEEFGPHFSVSGICLSGLHTCGNLSPTCIRMFEASESVSALCNVGCCYHFLTEGFENETPKNEAETFGFPMSKYLIDRKITLGQNARMTACQAHPRVVAQREVPHNHLFYRALLEVLIKHHLPEQRNRVEVGRMKLCSSFAEYVRKSSTKVPTLDFGHLSDDQLMDFHQQHSTAESFLHIYYLTRQAVGSAVETVILLDRILYLKELEERGALFSSRLVRFFDEVISPRCYGLVAIKRRNE